MASSDLGWAFDTRGTGTWAGHNDSGLAHFRGDRYGGLAREIIQNSLDARADGDRPVTVGFKKVRIRTSDIPGHKKLLDVYRRCISAAESAGETDKAKDFYTAGASLLEQNFVDVLEILEHNTTGMVGPCEPGTQYHAYMKASGQSQHKRSGSGGSHGIGKNAPLTVSNLRTVFVSTQYETEDGSSENLVQGRCLLMSHYDDDGNLYDSVGFWGEEVGCMPVEDQEHVPGWLRRTETGTTIFVLGFMLAANWEKHLKAAVVQNFFAALQRKRLIVEVEGDVIDASTINAICTDEDIKKSISENSGQPESYDLTGHFLECVKESEEVRLEKTENLHLGNCSIRIVLYDGAPRRVCILRNDMLITSELDGLKQFPAMKDFAAVVECTARKGIELLRRMEPPKHDTFKPDELDTEDERSKGKTALRLLRKAIRERIKMHAQVETEQGGSVHFLREFFEDTNETETSLESAERDPEGALLWQPRPIRAQRPIQFESDIDDGQDDEEDADWDGEEGGGGNGGRKKEAGKGDGESPGERGATKSVPVPLGDVRAIWQSSRVLRIFFTPADSAQGFIRIFAMGADAEDTISIEKSNKHMCTNGGLRLALRAGKRESIEVTVDRPSMCAVKVTASTVS